MSLPRIGESAEDRALRRMSFWAHLGELRNRLIRALLWVAIASGFAYVFRQTIYGWLIAPLQASHPELKLNYFSPTEPFFVYLRIALYGGLVLASPAILLELWGFVAPALLPAERRIVRPILPLVLGLFCGGVAFVYFALLPVSLEVLLGFAGSQMQPVLSQERYFSFVLGLCMAGGLLFELPMVLSLLGWLGIVSAGWLWRQSAYALVILMVVSAVITPTGDAFTMLALTAPLMALYFLSIGLVWLIRRGRGAAER